MLTCLFFKPFLYFRLIGPAVEGLRGVDAVCDMCGRDTASLIISPRLTLSIDIAGEKDGMIFLFVCVIELTLLELALLSSYFPMLLTI